MNRSKEDLGDGTPGTTGCRTIDAHRRGASIAYEPLEWIAGFVGAGLTFAALTNTRAMARVLSLLPHNRIRKPDVQGC